jgi:dihydropteroate synthase
MFAWGARTYVMGIVNCSPDSFSGDGHAVARAAVEHALGLVDEGADVLDVGGESTRPGAEPVTADEELRRVLPVIEALAARTAVPLSVDTSKAGVASAALEAGATMVNDVRALLADPGMAEVAARHGAWVALMDNRLDPSPEGSGTSGYAPRVPGERDVVAEVAGWLSQRVEAAVAAGIPRGRIIVDPGLGFGKTAAQSFALLRRLGELKRHPALSGLPHLAGPSRKGFIGSVLDLPVEQRLEGTLAALALAIAGGADLVRVHDVRAAVRACRVADAIVRSAGPASRPTGTTPVER